MKYNGMKYFLMLVVVFTVASSAFGQIKVFDRLEMYYAQGHYKLVLRKSNLLLDNPEYDFSKLPAYYQSMAKIQLSQVAQWRRKHPKAFQEGIDELYAIKKSTDGPKILFSHHHEWVYLKRDLTAWAEDLKNAREMKLFDQVREAIQKVFDDVPDLKNESEKSDAKNEFDFQASSASKTRKALVADAQKQLGVPYVWAGSDPKGFDCSGFTSYIYKTAGVNLERRAADQYEKGTKIKEKNVRMGDLVFFRHGSGISHVGIVISDPGKPLTMIHASSSQGIVITEIDASSYWKQRLYGFASYLND